MGKGFVLINICFTGNTLWYKIDLTATSLQQGSLLDISKIS